MPSFDDIKQGLRAVGDVARQARNPLELAKLAVPARLRSRKVLNAQAPPPDAPEGGAEVVRVLRALRNQLKGQAYVAGGGVDYARLAEAPVFAELEATSRALQRVRPSDLEGDDARVAFWVNLYNVLMIHGVIALEIEESVREIPAFFTIVAYQVGEHTFTPDDIEHGLLRRNAPHPSSGGRAFEPEDGRLAWAPERLDPRVHAALVCVAQSCPPIAFYEADQLDAQLDLASANYVNAGVEVDAQAEVVHLPAIFDWYEEDFGGRAGLEAFLVRHAEGPLEAELERALELGWPWEVRPYDWSLNTL